MDEKLLVNVSIFFSVVGIIALYFISRSITVNETTIEKINEPGSLNNVVVKGTVADIKKTGSSTIIAISQDNTINAIVFNKNLSIEKGREIEVKGAVQEFKGKKSIIAEEIKLY